MNNAQLCDLVVTGHRVEHGQVTGATVVKRGGVLVCHGQLMGGLVIEDGGTAVIHGQVCRNVDNRGHLELYGQVLGRVIGPVANVTRPDQIAGKDLPVAVR